MFELKYEIDYMTFRQLQKLIKKFQVKNKDESKLIKVIDLN